MAAKKRIKKVKMKRVRPSPAAVFPLRTGRFPYAVGWGYRGGRGLGRGFGRPFWGFGRGLGRVLGYPPGRGLNRNIQPCPYGGPGYGYGGGRGGGLGRYLGALIQAELQGTKEDKSIIPPRLRKRASAIRIARRKHRR